MIIMKFGGTSVQDAASISRVAEIVSHRTGRRPVVVVSAMAGVTDALIRIGRLAAEGRLTETESLIGDLIERHLATARELLSQSADPAAGGTGYRQLERRLLNCFAEIVRVVEVIAARAELTPRRQDAIVSQGERLSSLIVEAGLRARAIPSEFADSRSFIITDDCFTRASVNMPETKRRTPAAILPIIQAGKVPVAQGFIGSTLGGEPTTIGRGGSDYSAAVIGAALGAEAVEIWTDVDGLMTADPRIVPEAQSVRSVSYDEAMELSRLGAKVLHPHTVLPALESNMNVYIYNSFNPSYDGTLIVRDPPPSDMTVKSIALKTGVRLVTVSSDGGAAQVSLYDSVFERLGRLSESSLIVNSSADSVTLALDPAESHESVLERLRGVGTVETEENKALVCLVGEGLGTGLDLAARLLRAIAGIKVDLIHRDPSKITLAFVLGACDAHRLVRQLHGEFFVEAGTPFPVAAIASGRQISLAARSKPHVSAGERL
jgi:aspartate kinase